MSSKSDCGWFIWLVVVGWWLQFLRYFMFYVKIGLSDNTPYFMFSSYYASFLLLSNLIHLSQVLMTCFVYGEINQCGFPGICRGFWCDVCCFSSRPPLLLPLHRGTSPYLLHRYGSQLLGFWQSHGAIASNFDQLSTDHFLNYIE